MRRKEAILIIVLSYMCRTRPIASMKKTAWYRHGLNVDVGRKQKQLKVLLRTGCRKWVPRVKCAESARGTLELLYCQ